MSSRLAGKVALITGAGGGIGSETARLFASEGAAVIVNDVTQDRAEAVAQSIAAAGGKGVPAVCDISSGTEVERMFQDAARLFGGIDILVNNAFFNVNDVTIESLEEADWDRTIAVCLKGPFLCTKHAIRLMRVRGAGSIVTLSSVNALFGVGETAYTAAKGGLISLMRLVAAEYGEWNIRSNVICPATISTQICMDYWNQFPSGFNRLQEMYPLKRIGTPLEVAQYALFLASDESSFVTGAVHDIDGGLLAGRKLEVA
ncbi:MAG TPA: SDR family NAD(P)-dependent oxidoreductase [Bryobacteraceae bacterium]|nr:SDR family NAD(P)-dependent oxidoreductase [Bryobacteraceae bacterium]